MAATAARNKQPHALVPHALLTCRLTPPLHACSTIRGAPATPAPQVASLGRVVPAGGAGAKGKGGGKGGPAVFCHLACALWVPEIEFADHEHMAGVRLDKLTAVRAKLRCGICKQAGGAAV